jgi:hypothetical protein
MTPEELAALAAAERSAQATEDTGSFEAIFNNVMNIPYRWQGRLHQLASEPMA